jgi:hypothetical protein
MASSGTRELPRVHLDVVRQLVAEQAQSDGLERKKRYPDLVFRRIGAPTRAALAFS